MQLRYFAINFCYKHKKTASYIPKPLEDAVSELSYGKAVKGHFRRYWFRHATKWI
jgi:hypothetical protein